MSTASSLPRKLRHIDSLRGYAILMVVACHTTREFADLPRRFASDWHVGLLEELARKIFLLGGKLKMMLCRVDEGQGA